MSDLSTYLYSAIVAITTTLCAAPAAGQGAGLPEGDAKPLVEDVCTACHRANQIIRSSGYTAEGWRELVRTMVDLSESQEEQDRIVRYLAAHFPPTDERAPTLVVGDQDVNFREWIVPTLGQRSRDPIEAADGAIWWAG